MYRGKYIDKCMCVYVYVCTHTYLYICNATMSRSSSTLVARRGAARHSAAKKARSLRAFSPFFRRLGRRKTTSMIMLCI